MENFIIEKVTIYSKDLHNAINNLLVQLNPTASQLSKDDVSDMINSQSNALFVAKDVNGKIVGMSTLVIYKIPIAKKAIIEDVVVDKDFRKKGIGTKLIKAAIELARKEKVSLLGLTSNPARGDANSLYRSLGFEKRDTNIYRLRL